MLLLLLLLSVSRWLVRRLFRHYVLIVDKMIQFSTEFIFVGRSAPRGQ